MIEAMNFLKAFYEAFVWPSFFLGMYLMSIGQTLINMREPGRKLVDPTSISWLGWLNILLFQFLFIRLAKVIEAPKIKNGWGILYIVWPISGWGEEPYKYVFGIKGFRVIIKPKLKKP